MSSTWGNRIKLSIFGESHGPAIGVVIDGLPAGLPIDEEALYAHCARRVSKDSTLSTPRKEADHFSILSGVYRERTTGAPLAAVIRNTNVRSADYKDIGLLARPGHADFTAFVKYAGCSDFRGSGHFSGRLTAPLVFAGGVCKQLLGGKGVRLGSHIYAIAGVADTPFDPVSLDDETLEAVCAKDFAVLDDRKGEQMKAQIRAARDELDSVGGIVECAALHLPVGIGDPMFDGLESAVSSILFGIPAVKGVEFGAGFAVAGLRGSQNNDPFYLAEDGAVKTHTNYHGGILGGISTGMPLLVRAAFKPTPSIGRKQQTVNLTDSAKAEIEVKGRHDPCIVVRAAVCAESALAVALAQYLL